MRTVMVFLFCLFSSFLFAQQKALKMPDFDDKEVLPPAEEYIEVTRDSYPGLNVDMEGRPVDEILDWKPAFQWKSQAPFGNAGYYQKAGSLLTQWGFPMNSSQLVSIPIRWD